MSGLVGLKLLILILVLVVAYHLGRIALIGRRMAFAGQSASLLDSKRSSYACMVSVLVLAIILIEGLVSLSVRDLTGTLLFRVHLAAAVSFVALAGFLRWQTGLKSRRFHRIAGYTALALFATAFGTGATLLVPL